MPLGDFVNQIPASVFLLIHFIGFAAGAYFAWRSFNVDRSTLGTAFSLYALAEISYMTYHLDWTIFLFAHTISEALVLVAVVLVFVGTARDVLAGATAPSRG